MDSRWRSIVTCTVLASTGIAAYFILRQRSKGKKNRIATKPRRSSSWPDDFCAAVDFVGDHGEDMLDDRTHLELYGWYKQATVGDCDDETVKAASWAPGARYYMTKSWEAKKGCPKDVAFKNYVAVVDDAKPDWREVADDGDIWIDESGKEEVTPSREPQMVVGYEDVAVDNSAAGIFCQLCAEGEIDKVREVLDKHPSAANMTDVDGMTPLHWACDRSQVEVCSLLLDKGANVNAKDSEGETPLSYACLVGEAAIVKILLEHGASTSVTNSAGDSVQTMMSDYEPDVQRLLRDDRNFGTPSIMGRRVADSNTNETRSSANSSRQKMDTYKLAIEKSDRERMEELARLEALERAPAIVAEELKTTAEPTPRTYEDDDLIEVIRSQTNLWLRRRRTRLNTDCFEVIDKLGAGSYGKVFRVEFRDPNVERAIISAEEDGDEELQRKGRPREFALKVLPKNYYRYKNGAAQVMAEREALLKGTHSSRIVTLYAAFQDRNNLYMLSELVPAGSLRQLLLSNSDAFTDLNVARFSVAEILLGIDAVTGAIPLFYKPYRRLSSLYGIAYEAYLRKRVHIVDVLDSAALCNLVHQMGFTHRDIKPDNVVVTGDGHLKLLDFGLCAEIDLAKDSKTGKLKERCGTPLYMSPEMIRGSYTRLCDLWAVGIIFFEMLFKDVPFRKSPDGLTCHDKIYAFPMYLSIPPRKATTNLELPEDCREVLTGLLTWEKNRLDFAAVKGTQFFAAVDWDELDLEKSPLLHIITARQSTLDSVRDASPARASTSHGSRLNSRGSPLPRPKSNAIYDKDKDLRFPRFTLTIDNMPDPHKLAKIVAAGKLPWLRRTLSTCTTGSRSMQEMGEKKSPEERRNTVIILKSPAGTPKNGNKSVRYL
ncbi:hypothetical protein FOL47_008045 [Perkinsus chesapeaki]|uniref:non-specific serine/threonine protein kinase n=1 Tax=Perkinsus chesapeaki TaxID=330153 RepID=A0A7J6N4R9_PERCH|nr:hypothetical protein FOL47_008045 [Perkinsus chesapeaki]